MNVPGVDQARRGTRAVRGFEGFSPPLWVLRLYALGQSACAQSEPLGQKEPLPMTKVIGQVLPRALAAEPQMMLQLGRQLMMTSMTLSNRFLESLQSMFLISSRTQHSGQTNMTCYELLACNVLALGPLASSVPAVEATVAACQAQGSGLLSLRVVPCLPRHTSRPDLCGNEQMYQTAGSGVFGPQSQSLRRTQVDMGSPNALQHASSCRLP